MHSGLVFLYTYLVLHQYSQRLGLQIACFANALANRAHRPFLIEFPIFKLSDIVSVAELPATLAILQQLLWDLFNLKQRQLLVNRLSIYKSFTFAVVVLLMWLHLTALASLYKLFG